MTVREVDLRCPFCDARNAVGATVVVLSPNGTAFCMVCRKTFDAKEPSCPRW